MSKIASISVPGGRRVARVVLASVLFAAAGSALGANDNRPGGSGPGQASRGTGNASGVSRMMSSATHSAGASRPAGGGGARAMPSGGSRMVSSGRSAAPAMVQQSSGRAGVQVRSQPSSQGRQGAGLPPGTVQQQAQPVRSQPQGSSMLSPQRYSGGQGQQSAPSAPAPRSAPSAPQGTQSAPMQNMPMPGIRGTPQNAQPQAARSSFARMATSGRGSGGVVSSHEAGAPTLGAPAAATNSVTPAGTGFQVNAGRPRGETSMFRTFFPARSSGGAPSGQPGVGAGAVGVSSGHWNSGHGSGGWHGGDWHGDGWHGGDWHGHDGHWSHGHDDHWHGSFFVGVGWYPYYYPYSCSSWWPYSGISFGLSYNSGWCWPYSSGYYYNPVSYAMTYPSYAPMDYGGYGGTVINNYYTAPSGADMSGATGMSALPGPVYVDNGFKPQPPADDTATVYRSLMNRGPMAWSDTATSIINAMVGAPADHRAGVAKQYLGRTPAGAWEATFEGRQDIDNATELTCRGTGTTTTGGRPTIIVRLNRKVDALTPGQRLSVTGRLVEVSVDDSSNPGGVLVLEDADVSW